MKNLFSFCLFLLVFQSSAQINVLWESRYNSAANNVDRVTDMYVDAAGNVYVTGASLNAAGATSGFDIVTIKYNSAGVQQWLATFNGSGSGADNAAAMAVDASGNVYVAGTSFRSGTDYDFVVIKYNNAGVQQWQIYNGGSFYDEARKITLDSGGNPIVVGGFQASASNTNYRTVKLNPASGAVTWFMDFSSTGNNLDLAVDVVTDASNNVYVTGHSFNTGQDLNVRTIKYNSSGTLQWNTQLNQSTINSYDMPVRIVVDGTNTYVLATTFNGAASQDDILLIKYNAAGTVVDTELLNGTANDNDKPNGLLLDGSGNLYVAGKIKGSTTAEDFLVAKYNSSFTLQWIDKFNGSGTNYDEAFSLSFDPTMAYLYATGYSYLSASNNDYLTIKYNVSTGAREWVTRFNGPANNSDQARVLHVDAAGNIYVSGDSKGAGTNFDYSTIRYCQLTTTAVADNDTICIGTPVNLSASGGITGYTWTPATGLSATTGTSVTAMPSSDVCYLVSSSDADGCTDVDTICIVVNPLPGPIIVPGGPTSFCAGDSVQLYASGFAAYNWNTGETGSMIVADTAGTYTVTVTDASGCQNFTSVNITVNALPLIDAGLNLAHCSGDTSQLSATGGVSYVWNSDPFISSTTVSNPEVYPSVGGTYWYYVTGTDVNGCSGVDSVMLTVNVLPVAPLLFRPPNSDQVFVTNYAGGITWFMNGSTITAAGSGNVIDLDDSTTAWGCLTGVITLYSAYHTDGNGCVSPVSSGLVVDTIYNQDCYDNIGIGEYGVFSHFALYPNPATEVIQLEFAPLYETGFELNLVDMSGQVIMSKKYEHVFGTCRDKISISQYSSGIYYVVLKSEDGYRHAARIIKQ